MSATSASTPRGNLTGSARALNDTVIVFYNTIQKWKSALLDGVAILQTVQEYLGDADKVEDNCQKLGHVVSSLKSHMIAMKECERKIHSLYLLNKEVKSPCLSWTFLTCVEAVEKVYNAYAAETDFREKLVSSLQTRNSKQLDVIAVFWLHCGQVNSQVEATLEALLRECMLKT